VKARRASLEQKIRFSDAIEEQQKALNKLKLQQQLSETLAEEAVYEEALKDECLFDLEGSELPNETEQMIDRFMAQPEFDPRSLSPTAGLLSAVIPNTEHPVTSSSDTGLPAVSSSGTGIPAASNPATGHPAVSSSGTGLPTASMPNTGHPAAPNPDTGYPAASSSATGLLAASMPYIVTSSLNTGHPSTSQFPAFSVGLDSLNTSQLLVSQTANSLTAPKLSTNTSTPVTPPKLASGTIYPVISSTHEPLHASLSLELPSILQARL